MQISQNAMSRPGLLDLMCNCNVNVKTCPCANQCANVIQYNEITNNQGRSGTSCAKNVMKFCKCVRNVMQMCKTMPCKCAKQSRVDLMCRAVKS